MILGQAFRLFFSSIARLLGNIILTVFQSLRLGIDAWFSDNQTIV